MDSILLVCGTVKYGDDDGEGDVTTGSTSFYNTAYPNVATYVASEEKLVAHNVRRAKLIVGNSVPASRTIAGISLQNDITAEELKDALGISNITVISTDRPPMGAPAEVDVDLLKAGDTWLQQGDNIVYKLVEAQYNYQPYPSAEPYHKFTWQPLNERYGVGNTEPPTSVTYQPIVYTVNEVQWSWLPVPEYLKGDHYLMLVNDEPTYYICVSGNMGDTGVCTYRWREEGGSGDVSTKMDLAPLNPTYEQITAMPSGQLYSDTTNHKGIIKGGQQFYDTSVAVRVFENNDGQSPPLQTISDNAVYNRGDMWINLSYQGSGRVCTALYICKSVWTPQNFVWQYRWLCLYGANSEYYTKTEIDSMIPTVPTNISAFTNDSGYLTLGTLPIYDGTVI